MTVNELKAKLKEIGIPDDWYHLEEKGNDDMQHCLKYADGEWSVYYSERGGKFDLSKFAAEAEACEEFLSRMKELQSYES